MRALRVCRLVTLAVVAVAVIWMAPALKAATAGPYVEFRLVRGGQVVATIGSEISSATPATAIFTEGQSLCATTFGSGNREPAADARSVLRLTASLLDEADGVYRLHFTSKRARTAGQTTAAASLEQIASMRDEDHLVLDLVQDAAPQPDCDARVLVIEARFIIKPEPLLARALFVADLWFAHRDDTGHETNQHLTLNVNSSTEMPFMFGDVLLPLPKLDPSQSDFFAFVRMTGSIKARARTDGQIDVDLSTKRNAGLGASDRPDLGSDGFGGGMRKLFTLREDTPVAFELPSPSGIAVAGLAPGSKLGGTGIGSGGAGSLTSTGALAPSNPAPAFRDSLDGPKVYTSRGNFVLNVTGFFKDHVTRLTLRIRRVK